MLCYAFFYKGVRWTRDQLAYAIFLSKEKPRVGTRLLRPFLLFGGEIHIYQARRPRKMKIIHLLIYFSFTHPLPLIQVVNKYPTVRSMLKT